MPTTLITGANKGLGRETARRLLAEGHDVWLGARDGERGRETADELVGRFVQLDVSDEASVRDAVEAIAAEGGLDVLVNNAGIADAAQGWPEVDLQLAEAVLATNVVGVMRVTQACWDLLQASAAPVVVNVSSSLGSLERSTLQGGQEAAYPGVAYSASKAGLNMVTVKLARAFPQARVTAVNPGYTATDLNGHQGTLSVEEGAQAIVAAALLEPDAPSGRFMEAAGPLPW